MKKTRKSTCKKFQKRLFGDSRSIKDICCKNKREIRIVIRGLLARRLTSYERFHFVQISSATYFIHKTLSEIPLIALKRFKAGNAIK